MMPELYSGAMARNPRNFARIWASSQPPTQPPLLISVQRKKKIPSDQGFMAVTVGFELTSSDLSLLCGAFLARLSGSGDLSSMCSLAPNAI
jgi:hypothetical protein